MKIVLLTDFKLVRRKITKNSARTYGSPCISVKPEIGMGFASTSPALLGKSAVLMVKIPIKRRF